MKRLGKTFSSTLPCCLLLSWLLGGETLPARELRVKSPAEFHAAVRGAKSGDVIKLAKGIWNDFHIKVNRGGAEGSPLEVRAESPGETVLGGSSDLEITAPYVTVDGLFFYKGAIQGGSDASVIQFKSHHGIVRNTAIVDYNPPAFDTKYYWVFFNGDNNLLDHCYFKGKNNLEPLIGNAIENSRHNGVVNCYFKNIPYDTGNGREDIRVWGYGKFDASADDGAYFTVQGNLFDHADGEGTEIVSLKSNHNSMLDNTVIATRGCLNIRRGDYNLVKGNIILGQGVAMANGLRMSGEHNVVQGNYVSGCGYGIRVQAGEYVEKPLTRGFKPHAKAKAKGVTTASGIVPMYPQVKDLTLTDNVIVGCSGVDLDVGSEYKKHWPGVQLVLLPEQCVFRNNRFVRPHGGVSIVGSIPDPNPPLRQFTFQPNRFEGNLLIGGKNVFPPAEKGCKKEPLPSGWAEETERAAFKPLAATDVGPAWIIALRSAGKFPMEDDASCSRIPAGDGKHKK